MEIRCPTCGKQYALPPGAVPAEGKRVRCKPCGSVFTLYPNGSLVAEVPGAVPSADAAVPAEPELWAARTAGGDAEGLRLEDLKAWIRQGALAETDAVRPPGVEEYLPAGEVEALGKWFRLRSRTSTPPPGRAAAPRAGSGERSGTVCSTHSDRPAQWVCEKCGIFYCDCAPSKEIQTSRFACCARCNEPVLKMAEQKVFTRFWREIPQVLTFSFRGAGWIYYLVGFVLVVVGSLPNAFALFTNLFISAFFFATALHLIRTSSRGAKAMPEFQEISSWLDDVVIPALKGFVATLVVLLPMVLYLVLVFAPALFRAFSSGRPAGLLVHLLVLFLLFLASLAYYPMVIGIVACWNSVGQAVNPAVVLRLIGQIKGEYVKMLLLLYPLGIFAFVVRVVVLVAFTVAGLGIVGGILNGVIELYVLFTSSHLIGRLLYENEEELGWS